MLRPGMLYLVDGIIGVNMASLLSRILARSSLLVRGSRELRGRFCAVTTSHPHKRDIAADTGLEYHKRKGAHVWPRIILIINCKEQPGSQT